MTGRCSISLCIIAKNEEQCIEWCINSARHLVYEIILVDTGSADHTREIAAKNGARVYQFPWQDDFAAARNHSLELAGCDWILVLDADEILEPVSIEDITGLLSQKVEGYFITIRSYLGNGNEFIEDSVVRLFKNNPRYRFENPIHEQVATSIKRQNNGAGLGLSKLLIHHSGYMHRQVEYKQKRRRNMTIINKALGEKGDPFLLYSLGVEYFQARRLNKGIECMKKALALMKGDEGYFKDSLVALGTGLLESNRSDDLWSFFKRALYMLPDDGDLHLLKGISLIKKTRPREAIEELGFALKRNSRFLPPAQIHSLMGDAFCTLNLFPEAREAYTKALKLNPPGMYPLVRLLELRQKADIHPEWKTVAGFASPGEKNLLTEKLCRLGEYIPALAVSLLSVLEASGGEDTRFLKRTCQIHRDALKRGLPEENPFFSLLDLCAGEMVLCAEMAHRGCPPAFFSAAQRISDLSCTGLDLLSVMMRHSE